MGRQFGSWTILQTRKGKHPLWFCACVCGTKKWVDANSVRRGKSTSCRCFMRSADFGRFRHGKTNAPIYAVWNQMVRRCTKPAHPEFVNYGARGITVCDRWRDFRNFLIDMGEPPAGKSIERRDNTLGYEPDNCYWATQAEQTRNMRRNVMVTIDGVTLCFKDWCIRLDVNYERARWRRRCGASPADAILSLCA